MDNNNNNNSNNNFFGGFLLGVLIGAAVVFLLGTKKGKKLLKVISEDGVDKFSNLLDETSKSVDLDEIVQEDEKRPYVKKVAPREEFVQKREFAVKESSIEEKPKVRRFFRGISRRVN